MAILAKLADDDKILDRIEQIAKRHLSVLDVDELTDQVYYDLEAIDVEEVWDRSGQKRHGYIDPGDMAFQMFEEALEPHLERLRKSQKLGMAEDAENYCIGILNGIYRFAKESTSEYKNWAMDAPGEYFDIALNEWKESVRSKKKIKEMKEYLVKTFPDW